ncbi:MAG: hypothetical protein NT069_23915 [Planctomycetota bacterium]|nr:hypothetical protein [Planctomycetota bacterium]
MSPLDGPTAKNQRNLATSIALLIVLIIAGSLFALVSLVFPQVQGLLIVGLIFVVPTLFHYFVWGRWMMRVRERVLEEERREAATQKNGGGRE